MSETSKTIVGSFKTIIMAIVVGLLLVSLAIWGVADAFAPKTRDAAAMVGTEKITLVEFDGFFRRRLRDENKQLPQRISTKQAHARGFHTTVLNQLITETLIQLDADALGVEVNRADALRYVEGLEVFNNVMTGKLDEAKLAQRLAQSDARQSRKQFETDVRKALRQAQTMASITTGLIAPNEYATQQYKFMTEQRSVKLLHITREALPTMDDPSDEVLKAYIETNPNAYIAPEYRKFTLLRVETTDVFSDMEASEEEIKDQFDYKIKVGKLGTNETRSLTHFVSQDKAAADIVTASLNGGKTIDAITSELSLEAPVTYTDVLETAVLDPNAGEAAFGGELSKAQTVEGSFGTWYSVIVTDINAGQTPDLESERDAITIEIKTEKAERFIYDIQDKLQTALAEGKTIEEAAKDSGISAASFDFVSRIGETQSGAPMSGDDLLPGVSREDLILKEVFTSDLKFEGDIFETSTKGIAAVRVDAVKESTQRPFADIREQALKQWHLVKANKALGELLNTYAKRIAGGESFESLVASVDKGVSLTETSASRLTRGLPSLSPETNVRLFDARIHDTIRGTGANGLDRVLGVITEIVPNTEILIGSIADTLQEQTSASINNDIQQAYHTAMLKRNPASMMRREY